MKIAFISPTDPTDKRSWSGILYNMYHTLEEHVGPVSWLHAEQNLSERIVSKLYPLPHKLLGKNHIWHYSLSYSKLQGKRLSKQLAEQNYDLIFAAVASRQLAFLETDIPIIYSSDATFKLLDEEYGKYRRFSCATQQAMHQMEQQAIDKTNILVPPTQWVAKSALDDYGADPAKIHVVPFGSNITDIPDAKSLEAKTKGDICKLIFIGVEWERKGGPIAFDATMRLNAMGLKTHLTVIGCTPPEKFMNEHVHVIPFINKNDPQQAQLFHNLMLEHHFLLLPTRAECFGIVFAEASAFGLPSISTRTGGVPEVVEDDINGYTLPIDAEGDQYAATIFSIFNDDSRYRRLVSLSRARYDQHLNWGAWGKSLKEKIDATTIKNHANQA